MAAPSDLQRQREASEHPWLEDSSWNVLFSDCFHWFLLAASGVLSFAAFPVSLAGHQPGRTSSAQTREGSRVLQLPVCLAFPPLPQFPVLFYMAKTKEFIFIKCLNRLFNISLIFQRCQIPRLPLSANASSLLSSGEAGLCTVTKWEGSRAAPWHGAAGRQRTPLVPWSLTEFLGGR